ncbi:hypothetical protein [Mesorhizobium sp.]|uniref:hypothetical protein n=1 Tax=Mesorhizobium sp. TaxID=1871066 RepID=UPI0025FB6681|nr:hypothetical protein [Mesorhizobium sp.]
MDRLLLRQLFVFAIRMEKPLRAVFLELLWRPRRTMTCASLEVKKRADQSHCKRSKPPLKSGPLRQIAFDETAAGPSAHAR